MLMVEATNFVKARASTVLMRFVSRTPNLNLVENMVSLKRKIILIKFTILVVMVAKIAALTIIFCCFCAGWNEHV